MGGVAAYQAASALNTALNPVSRWVKKSLLNSSSVRQKSTTPLRVLEIGAVNTQLLDWCGSGVRAIDLHTVEPRIEQCDFFTLPHGGEVDAAGGCPKPYDAIVLLDGPQLRASCAQALRHACWHSLDAQIWWQGVHYTSEKLYRPFVYVMRSVVL